MRVSFVTECHSRAMVVGPKIIQSRIVCILTCSRSKQEGTKTNISQALYRKPRNGEYKAYCSTVHFLRITSIYQPTNAHIISYKARLKHFKTLRHISILSDHHHGALFLAKVI